MLQINPFEFITHQGDLSLDQLLYMLKEENRLVYFVSETTKEKISQLLPELPNPEDYIDDLVSFKLINNNMYTKLKNKLLNVDGKFYTDDVLFKFLNVNWCTDIELINNTIVKILEDKLTFSSDRYQYGNVYSFNEVLVKLFSCNKLTYDQINDIIEDFINKILTADDLVYSMIPETCNKVLKQSTEKDKFDIFSVSSLLLETLPRLHELSDGHITVSLGKIIELLNCNIKQCLYHHNSDNAHNYVLLCNTIDYYVTKVGITLEEQELIILNKITKMLKCYNNSVDHTSKLLFDRLSVLSTVCNKDSRIFSYKYWNELCKKSLKPLLSLTEK